jgi:polyhydroxyalkanoate synthase
MRRLDFLQKKSYRPISFDQVFDEIDESFQKIAGDPRFLAMLGHGINVWSKAQEFKGRSTHPFSPSNSVRLLESAKSIRLRPTRRIPLFESTPSQTIHREGSLRVKHYSAWQAPARGSIVIFPSIINRPYILDLGRGRSLIGYLVKNGFEVSLFDWGCPTARERDLGLKQLLADRIPRAMNSVRRFSNYPLSAPRALLGHCLGGNIALKYAENHREEFDRLVLLTTPIDTENDALLTKWAQIPEWDAELYSRVFETIPWMALQTSFLLQRPSQTPRRWLKLLSRFTDRDFLESWLQMEIWSNDGVSIPSQLFRDLLLPLYRENVMFRSSDLSLPIFSLIAKDDHIVPLESAIAIQNTHQLSQHETHIASGGHVGAVIAAKTRREIWPKLIDFLNRES